MVVDRYQKWNSGATDRLHLICSKFYCSYQYVSYLGREWNAFREAVVCGRNSLLALPFVGMENVGNVMNLPRTAKCLHQQNMILLKFSELFWLPSIPPRVVTRNF